uniref:Uncharacterized protein n=1 Tax=Acrobeloides nanus TaxID=290746 RepID=A0A914DMP3_9BILA
MAMFVFEDNKVVLKPENASPMILGNLLQCKPVGMVLLDQGTGDVYPYPSNPNHPFRELVTPGPFLVISNPRFSESSDSEPSTSLGVPLNKFQPPKSPLKTRTFSTKHRTY